MTVLGVLNIVLALALAVLWFGNGAGGRREPPAVVLPDLAVPGTEKTAVATADHYQAILDRPLFSPNRRPPPVAAAETDGQPALDPFKDVRLYGLFDSGQMGGAIVSIAGAKPRRVHFGEKIGDWTLRSINARELVLSRGENETRTLRLAYAVSSQKAPAVASASQPAPAPSAASSPTASGKTAATQAATAGSGAPAAPAQPAVPTAQQRIEELARERLARRNQLRAENGLPPISQ